MNVYYQNEKAALSGSQTITGSYLNNIYDPVLELRADFSSNEITINGVYNENFVAVDSVCLGYTNASLFTLTTREGTRSGRINSKITVLDFTETNFIDWFELELEGMSPLYLGYLYLGKKTVFPLFEVEPGVGKKLNSESSRSFGGQAFGMRRKTLRSFSANFPRFTSDEKIIIDEYIESVLNIEPHIIDPYPEARDEFPPMYATLNTNDIQFKKRNENGFFYSGSLSWQEAR